jgi:CRISPR-associated protein Csd1
VQRIVTFLRRVSLEELKTQDSWDEIVKTNPNLSFRFRGCNALVCRHPDVVAKLASNQDAEDGDRIGTCLITGQPARIKTLHTSVKGVYGAQTTGANIVSFNLDAFRSYGKSQGQNAPVGSESEFAYTTALNTLLRRESKQKLRVGDATTVFWSKEHTSFEADFACFFEEPPKTSPDSGTQKIKALFDSLHSGAYVESDADIPFYILGLSPNASRISIRFWQEGTISDIAVRIKRYFEDFAIIKPPHEPKYYSVWRILVNTATQDKSENIPPNVAGAFMQSILTGAPYPATLLQAVLRRIKSDPEQRVKPVRAALIKAYLNRYYEFYPSQHYKEVGMELDSQQPSIGYQLGRLFAVLEKIQEEANPGLNATIRERYYGAACATPVTVFANLLRLKNHHLAKMENKGRVVNLERLLGEIISNITSFPAHLNLHEQGHFAIGYYHQRQAFFTKKEKTEIA